MVAQDPHRWEPLGETPSQVAGALDKFYKTMVRRRRFPAKGKFTEDGRPVLRLIINLTPANSIMRAIEGDVGSLAGAAHWMNMSLGINTVM